MGLFYCVTAMGEVIDWGSRNAHGLIMEGACDRSVPVMGMETGNALGERRWNLSMMIMQ